MFSPWLFRLGVPAWVAPLVARAVDLSIVALLLSIRYLSMRGAGLDAVRPARRLLLASSVVALALNIVEPLIAGNIGRALFDAVGPLLLIGWAEKAAELHRMHHSTRSVLRSTCLVNAAAVRSMGCCWPVTCGCVAAVVSRSHDVASFATEVVMVQSADLTGSVQAVLPVGVRYLDPEPAVFEAMLEGWTRQQYSRMLRETTIGERARLVRRFAEFTGQYPWQWTPSEVEAFISELRSGPKPVAFSTVRGYQTTLRLFVEFVTDPRYGWPAECQTRFGMVPSQIG
jgi:hypothetical protein